MSTTDEPDITPEQATQAVIASYANTPNPRLKQVLESVTQHLHDFVRDVDPTRAELEEAAHHHDDGHGDGDGHAVEGSGDGHHAIAAGTTQNVTSQSQ